MKDRGKRELEAYNNAENFVSYDFPCKKHPSSSSSSTGICAYCLSDRLVQLVCPDCGEQRLSSYCFCSSDFASKDAGNSGARISLLIENDKPDIPAAFRPPSSSQIHLKRSSSTSVGDMSRGRIRESGKEGGSGSGSGFWKIGKLFSKKKLREKKGMGSQVNDFENKSELGVSDCVPPVSRSRSLCSFRGFYDTESSGGLPMSSSAARASSVSGNFVLDSAKRSCFSESEARISNFDYAEAFNFYPNGNSNNNGKSSIFSWREGDCNGDDPAFIDLKLHDLYSDVNNVEMFRRGGMGTPTTDFGLRGADDVFKNGRLSVSERELRKCRKSYKVWKWFFRQQSSSRSKEDREDHAFKS